MEQPWEIEHSQNSSGYMVDKAGRLVHLTIYTRTHGYIPNGYEVHHIDWDRYNNRIDNLIAIPKEFHRWLHLHQDDIEDMERIMGSRSSIMRRETVERWLGLWLSKHPPSVPSKRRKRKKSGPSIILRKAQVNSLG